MSKVLLPPLKLYRQPPYFYLVTYKSRWEPAVKDESGKIIKKGRCATYERHTVASIQGGPSGYVSFREHFYKDYPELRNYAVYRNADSTFTFKKISDLNTKNAADTEAIDAAVASGEYEVDPSGKVVKSAEGIPMSVDPAKLVESNLDKRVGALSKVPSKNNALQLLERTQKGGAIILLDDVFDKTCMRKALVRACKRSSTARITARKALQMARVFETFVGKMVVNGNNTYEDIEAYVKEQVTYSDAYLSKTAYKNFFKRVVTTKFIEHFNHAFLEEYCKRNNDRVIKHGLVAIIDGSPISHKNTDRKFVTLGMNKDGIIEPQLNIQCLCDAAKDGLPLVYDTNNGSTNDVTAFHEVLTKFKTYEVKLEKFTVVVDRGYDSNENRDRCLRQGTSFIFNCRIGSGSVAESMITKAIQKGVTINNSRRYTDSGRNSFICIKSLYSYDPYPVVDKKASKKEETSLYYHVFYDLNIYQAAVANNATLLDIVCDRMLYGLELNEKQKKFVEKFGVPGTSYKKGDVGYVLQIDNAKFNAATRNAGFRVLVTNDPTLSSVEVDRMYSSRGNIEVVFQRSKQLIDGQTTKAKSDEGIEIKVFLQHLASIAITEIHHRIRDARRKYAGECGDTFRSMAHVFNSLDDIIAMKFPSGVVWKAITGKQAKLLACLNCNIPKTMMNISGLDDSFFVDDSVSVDDASDENRRKRCLDDTDISYEYLGYDEP